jgi:hypothetical protein
MHPKKLIVLHQFLKTILKNKKIYFFTKQSILSKLFLVFTTHFRRSAMETRDDLRRPLLPAKNKFASEDKIAVDDREPLYSPPYDALDQSLITSELPKEKKSPQKKQAKKELGLDDVIIPSDIVADDSKGIAAKVVAKFNLSIGDNKIIEEPTFRKGKRIERNQYYLAHRNKIPELAAGNGTRLTTMITFGYTEAGEIGIYDQNSPFFGAYGKFVLNVPRGQFAKALAGGRVAQLYGEGVHVIDDPLFSFNPQNGFVPQNATHISHQDINIVRALPGTLAKVTVNNVPYLLPHREEPYVFKTFNFQYDGAENEAKNNIDYGYHHLVRVPPGQVAKVIKNNIPEFLHPKEDNNHHYIESNGFQFNGFSNQTANYIQNGNKHFVRVPPGKFAKVVVDGIPKLLSPPEDNKAHEFTTANFIFDPARDYVDQTEPYIQHGTRHRLCIPKGSIAKVWFGSKPVLLEAKVKKQDEAKLNESGPHAVEAQEKKSSDAKQNESEPLSLEAQEKQGEAKKGKEEFEIYDFDNPNFKLDKVVRDGQIFNFEESKANVIQHGSITRIVTPDNCLAIVNKSGKLCIEEGVYYTDSALERFTGFIDTSLQNLEFPSKRTREKVAAELAQVQESKNACSSKSDRINFGIFMTSDSVEIGLKIFVAFSIPNKRCAEIAFSQFKTMEKITDHIEGIVRSDMTRIVKQYSSQTFNKSNKDLSFSPIKIAIEQKNEDKQNNLSSSLGSSASHDASVGLPIASAPIAPHKTDLEDAESMLQGDLEKYGIMIKCMTIEQFKFIDKDLAHKIQENALATAQANAKLSTVDQAIALQKSDAMRDNISQQQMNQAKIAAAEADRAKMKVELATKKEVVDNESQNRECSAQAEAKANLLLAEAKAKANLLLAEAEAKAAEMKGAAENKILEAKGELYSKFPQLVELITAEAKFAALAKVTMTVGPSGFENIFNAPGLLLSQPRLQGASLQAPGLAYAPAESAYEAPGLTFLSPPPRRPQAAASRAAAAPPALREAAQEGQQREPDQGDHKEENRRAVTPTLTRVG